MKHPFINFDSSREAARKVLPRLVFDFMDGASGEENGLKRNRQAFHDTLLMPRVLRDPNQANIQARFLGKIYGRPFGCAPMGLCNLAGPLTDRMLAQAAAQYKFPVGVSAASSTRLESYIEQAEGFAWFQLYVTGDMALADSLIARAEAAGYENLLLTVDVPRLARRPRDTRNGFRTPFRLNARHALDFAFHPHWTLRTIVAGIPQMANYDQQKPGGYDRNAPRRGADWTYLRRLRERWPHKLIVKGVLSPEDAAEIRTIGADAIYVSNHGGRQLDAAPATLTALQSIRQSVGTDYPLILDGGVRQGEDIAKALAQGADFIMMGRPFLYAAAADPRHGIASLVTGISDDLDIAMAQLGVEQLSDLGPHCIAC
jgi:(S)-mandelate dehydrogenase